MIVLIFIPGIYKDTEGLTLLRELPDEMLNGTFYGIVFLIALLFPYNLQIYLPAVELNTLCQSW